MLWHADVTRPLSGQTQQQQPCTDTPFHRMMLCSDDGFCPCACNYAVDASCTCRDLDGTVTITVTKPPVHVLYRLKYIRNADFHPYEEAIYMQDNCDDRPLEIASNGLPTRNGSCDWHSDSHGYKPHSQVLDFLTWSSFQSPFMCTESPFPCTVAMQKSSCTLPCT